jgi:hypothetical protein
MQAAGGNGFVKRQLAIAVPIAGSDDDFGDTCDEVESTKQSRQLRQEKRR